MAPLAELGKITRETGCSPKAQRGLHPSAARWDDHGKRGKRMCQCSVQQI